MAFFVPRKAASYEGWGETRRLYSFMKGIPTEVTEPFDVAKFRNQRDMLMEVDAQGNPAEQPRQSPDAGTINRPDVQSAITTADLASAKKVVVPKFVTRRSKT